MRTSIVLVMWLGAAVVACDDRAPAELRDAPTALAPRGPERRYIVSYDRPERGRLAITRAGVGRLVHELPRGAAVMLDDADAERLRREPEVRAVELDPERTPDGLGAGETLPYGVSLTQADQIADGPGDVTVCIIDSGFAIDHEDLQEVEVEGVDDAVYGSSWMDDPCGHGTHVGGIVAALDNDVGVVGVSSAGGLRIRAVKVFVGPTCEKTYGSDLIAALAACRAGVTGRLVVSMSLGGDLPSAAEEAAFAAAAADGVLMVASAGNGGTTKKRYPAAYASVIAVGAVHESKAHWASSQRFAEVELAAPGVGVASTVPWSIAAVRVADQTVGGRFVLESARVVVSGALADGGSCGSAGAWSGKIVRCRLGSTSVLTQVASAERAGAAGVLLWSGGSSDANDTPYYTLGATGSALPVLGINRRDGEALAPFMGLGATLDTTKVLPASGYEAWNGTSMAVPYVSGIAAKLWTNRPAARSDEVRWALAASAQDLGASGRDTSFGFGLVQAAGALAKLEGGTCKAAGAKCSKATDCCQLRCSGKANKATCG